jgi:hypothetical protein
MTPAALAPPWLKRIGRPIRDARRHRVQLSEARRSWETEWQIERELDDLTRGSHPLIVGPWSSEVGYEALYWIPFLRWVMDAFRVDPARVVAVSRGGVAPWYHGIANRYAEIWDEVAPETFAARITERGRVKQMEVSAFDLELAAAVSSRMKVDNARILHPSLMYRLFSLFWSGHRALSFIDSHTRFERIASPEIVPLPDLPAEFVAVKFYAARSMPDTPAVRQALAGQVAALAERLPVVLLDTGLVLDEHADYDLRSGSRILSARAWMTPRNNLGVQTQIIARARAFVGTCGSVAWLAPMLGVDTAALFIDPKWLHAHLGVALRAAHKVGGGHFAAADLRAVHPLSNL